MIKKIISAQVCILEIFFTFFDKLFVILKTFSEPFLGGI